ncbi:MAG TPA: hypothetical protein VKW78_21870 [Terriglobales bacterium]|nr:hypothetical protein [Terriglobales bacterium]
MKAFAALLVLTAAAYSQQPPTTVPQQLAAMKQCGFLEGKWKGDGWMMMGPSERRTFVEIENVEPKLGGLVLQVEGLGRNSEGKTVHEALALLSFDAEWYEIGEMSPDGNTWHKFFEMTLDKVK